MVDQHTRLHTWPFLSIFVEIFPRRRWIRRSGERNHRRIICFHSRPSQKFFELKISRGGSSIEGRKRRGRTLLFIVDILRNKKGREGRSRISQWKQTCVPSAIERNARAEISFHLGDSVKNSPGRAHGPRFKGRKSGFIRFFSFSLSSATSFSSSSFSERCPDCVRLRSSNERVQTKLLFR